MGHGNSRMRVSVENFLLIKLMRIGCRLRNGGMWTLAFGFVAYRFEAVLPVLFHLEFVHRALPC